jgi:peptidyl-prolyl cis-trans isomerase C
LLSLLIFPVALCGWLQSAGRAPQAASPQKTQSVSGERVVLSIGDQKMTAADVEKFIQALPPNLRAFYEGQGKRLLPANIVRMKVLAAEAIKEKLDQQPQAALAIEIARESILADTAQEHLEQGITVSDQELRELYQKDKTTSEEVRIAHILIRTDTAPFKSGDPSHPGLPESEARKKLEDIRKQILAGADFAQMAKQYSEDAATAASGGDMGVIQRDKIVPPIVNAANALEPGQVSDIVPTPSGLEIIKVEEKRAKPFEELQPALELQIRQSKTNDIIQHLMQESGAFIDQEFFSGPSAKQTTSPAPTTH